LDTQNIEKSSIYIYGATAVAAEKSLKKFQLSTAAAAQPLGLHL